MIKKKISLLTYNKMPPKRVCSDKEPLGNNKVRELPGVCFSKGLRAGFAAGIQKGTKQANEQGVKRARVVREIPKAALRMQAVRGQRKARERVAQQAQERESALMAANDVNIQAPRVRNPARRQRFRNFYGLDNAAEVVAQNPVANIVEIPAIQNIKQYIDDRGGRPRGVKNRTDLLAELVQRERFPNVPTGLTNIKRMGKRRMIEMLVATGRYVSGGEVMR